MSRFSRSNNDFWLTQHSTYLIVSAAPAIEMNCDFIVLDVVINNLSHAPVVDTVLSINIHIEKVHNFLDLAGIYQLQIIARHCVLGDPWN
jgi:hypothetical protein